MDEIAVLDEVARALLLLASVAAAGGHDRLARRCTFRAAELLVYLAQTRAPAPRPMIH